MYIYMHILQLPGRAARDPRVREVVHDVGYRSVEAIQEVGSHGMRTASQWVDEVEAGGGRFNLGPWQAVLAFVACWCVAVIASIALFFGCFMAGGGGWWFGRTHRADALPGRLQEMESLDALARQAIAGGSCAQRLAALEAGVDPLAMQEWCELWVRAMRGLRKTSRLRHSGHAAVELPFGLCLVPLAAAPQQEILCAPRQPSCFAQFV